MNRRIGGLEINHQKTPKKRKMNRRIGGLEIFV